MFPVQVSPDGQLIVGMSRVFADNTVYFDLDGEASTAPDGFTLNGPHPLSGNGDFLGGSVLSDAGLPEPAVLTLATRTIQKLVCPERPFGCTSSVNALNGAGNVAVGYARVLNSRGVDEGMAVRWVAGAPTVIQLPEVDEEGRFRFFAEAVDVSSDGRTVLIQATYETDGSPRFERIALWRDGALQFLPGPPNYDAAASSGLARKFRTHRPVA